MSSVLETSQKEYMYLDQLNMLERKNENLTALQKVQ